MNCIIRNALTVLLLVLGSAPSLYAQFNPTNPPEPQENYYYNVTVATSPANVAYTYGAGKYLEGTNRSISYSLRNSSYKFSHWTLNGEHYSTSSSFTYKIAAGDAAFVAHFVYAPTSPQEPSVSNEYKLTLTSDNDAACTFNRASVTKVGAGNNVTLTAYVNQGYELLGWYKGEELLSTSTSFSYQMPAEDVTLVAKFRYNPFNPTEPEGGQEDVDVVGSFKLIYMVDGEVYKVVKVKPGSDVVPESVPFKEGYTFSGWSEVPATMPAEDVVIEGTFTVNYYVVTYLVDSAVWASDSVAYGSAITLIDDPVKDGHTFSGWSEAPATMPAEDVVIEGSFTVNYYVVTYLVDSAVWASDSVAYGSEIVLRDAPTKDGHTFSGWSEAPATMLAEDIVIEGTFTVNIYNVFYYVGQELVHTDEVAYGEAIPVYVYEPVDDGEVFVGWVGEVYEAMPAHDVTYVADIETGIDEAYNEVKGENGKVKTVYDFQGRKVDTLNKGVYIIDGQKVLVK